MSLQGIIFKKEEPGKLTTGAKIGGTVVAAGGLFLLNKALNKKKKKDEGNAPAPSAPEVATSSLVAQSGGDILGTEVPQKSNTLLWVVLGVVVIGGTGAAIYFMNKTKA